MYPVTCRNCGALNLFTGPPPARVKCDSCGNLFRTDQGATAPMSRQRKYADPAGLGDIRSGPGSSGGDCMIALAVMAASAAEAVWRLLAT
jgi:ribosomal protein S27E